MSSLTHSNVDNSDCNAETGCQKSRGKDSRHDAHGQTCRHVDVHSHLLSSKFSSATSDDDCDIRCPVNCLVARDGLSVTTNGLVDDESLNDTDENLNKTNMKSRANFCKLNGWVRGSQSTTDAPCVNHDCREVLSEHIPRETDEVQEESLAHCEHAEVDEVTTIL